MQVAAKQAPVAHSKELNNKKNIMQKQTGPLENRKIQPFPSQKKLPQGENITPPPSYQMNGAHFPRSYAMIVSSFEHVFHDDSIDSDIADQLGKTITGRLKELNKASLRQIESLPEYQKLEIEDISTLGDELTDLLTDQEQGLRAFALLKNTTFANLMESKESVHRSFAEMMQRNGDEQLLFGAIEAMKGINEPFKTSENPSQQGINLKV